mmetsp:Transcript_131036/g.355606  ORF Transcript_131036/g.355606 Transcript_131036/m.355606 type:complete len:384 (+) Transcript_131036:581-1732(+)
MRQDAIVVLVQCSESLLHIFDVLIAQELGSKTQRDLLKLRDDLELAQLCDQALRQPTGVPAFAGLQPPILKQHVRRRPRRGLESHHSSDDGLGRVGHVVPLLVVEIKRALLYLLQEVALVPGEERRGAAEQHVRDHPCAPHVAQLVVALGQDLRGYVHRRPAARRQHLARLVCPRYAEIYQLERRVIRRALQKHVLWLHVPVHYPAAVQVVQRRQQLPNVRGRLALTERAPCPHDLLEELAAAAKLKNQVELHLVLEHLVELRDVRVVQLLLDRDLGLGRPRAAGDGLHGPQLPARAGAAAGPGLPGGQVLRREVPGDGPEDLAERALADDVCQLVAIVEPPTALRIEHVLEPAAGGPRGHLPREAPGGLPEGECCRWPGACR